MFVLTASSRPENLSKLKCNITKALSQRIDSVSDDDVNTIMASMQGIIDEGSDHIKDLELKIKTQGGVQEILYIYGAFGVKIQHFIFRQIKILIDSPYER